MAPAEPARPRRRSGNPPQCRVVRQSSLAQFIPVLGSSEFSRVTVEEKKLRAALVKIGVRVAPVSDGRQILRVKEPDQTRPVRQVAQADRSIVVAGSVDMRVKAVVEQVSAVAAARVAEAYKIQSIQFSLITRLIEASGFRLPARPRRSKNPHSSEG